MRYFSVLIIIFFLFTLSVFGSQEITIFDDIADTEVSSENSKIFDDISKSVLENQDVFSETDIYLNHKGEVFGLIQKDRFGIIFDNDESLIVSLEIIEEREPLEIKRTLVSDIERYSEDACVSEYGQCKYTEEGYVAVEKEKTGFFEKIKGFFSKIFSFLFSVFTSEKDVSNSVEVHEELGDEEKEKLSGDTWKKFFDYRESKEKEGYSEEKSSEIKNSIFKLVANSDSLKDIMNLRMLIDQYCYEEAKESKGNSKDCERLRLKLKEKGDELKEKLFADIKEGDEDGLRKLIELRAVLMAQEKASKGTSYEKGETDIWFSSENVSKINKGIREKAKKWWKENLKKVNSVEDIWKWRFLALAYESASMEYRNSDSVFGEYAGKLMEDVKKQVAGVVAEVLIDLDICNPDLEKLNKLMDDLVYKDDKGNQIYNENCLLLLSKSACDALEKKDLQKAYAVLFYDAGLDDNNPNSLPVPPIKCQKDENVSLEESDDLILDRDYDTDTEIDIEDDEPNEPESLCTLVIFEDEFIGWDYEVENCTKDHDEGLICWERCGDMPPLVIKDIETNECYEVLEGYINDDLTVPCHQRPMPLEGVEECVKQCLME